MAGSSIATILVVEDYKDSREMIRFLLEGLNYHVFEVENGQNALILAAREEPDLIMTDFNLTDILGTELIRRLRKLSHKLSHIPIIMLTAHDREELYEMATAAGCTALLTKPVSFVVLEKTITALLEESRELNGPVNDIP